VNACRDRALHGQRELRWRISLNGDTWDEDTVTIGEIRMVERTTGTNWAELSPLVSADVATAFFIAHWHKVGGMELAEAWDKVEAINAKAVIDAVSEYEVEASGKDRAAPST
jgi:hypothetical protein